MAPPCALARLSIMPGSVVARGSAEHGYAPSPLQHLGHAVAVVDRTAETRCATTLFGASVNSQTTPTADEQWLRPLLHLPSVAEGWSRTSERAQGREREQERRKIFRRRRRG